MTAESSRRAALRRALLGLLLVPSLALLAFAGAMVLAGRLMAPDRRRTLDGGLDAAEWGLGAALLAAIAGVLLAVLAPPRALARCTLVAAALAVVVVAWGALAAQGGA